MDRSGGYQECPVVGNRESGVIAYSPRAELCEFGLWSDGCAVELFGHPDFVAGRFALVPIKSDVAVDSLQFLTAFALEHAVYGFRHKNLNEIGVALVTEYGRQLGCGAHPLPNHRELGKRYVPQGALYLFLEESGAAAFAKMHAGTTF